MSYSEDAYSRNKFIGCQAAFAGKPAPTMVPGMPARSGRLSGRLREQARSHNGSGYVRKIRSAVRPPSLASQLLQGVWVIRRIRSAVRPPSLASQLLQGVWVIRRIRSAVRPSSRASQLLQGVWVIRRIRSAVRPSSRASLAPTGVRVHRRFSPLIRPSVSSPAALDLDPPAPSGG